jgi:hypothetical protein
MGVTDPLICPLRTALPDDLDVTTPACRLSLSGRMVRTRFGPGFAGWLQDPSVVEIMLNPDGRL